MIYLQHPLGLHVSPECGQQGLRALCSAAQQQWHGCVLQRDFSHLQGHWGCFRLLLLCRATPLGVVDQYTAFIGRPAPMPYWSLVRRRTNDHQEDVIKDGGNAVLFNDQVTKRRTSWSGSDSHALPHAQTREEVIKLNEQFSHFKSLWGWRCRAKLAIRGSPENPLIGLYQEGTHNVVDIPQCKAHPLSILWSCLNKANSLHSVRSSSHKLLKNSCSQTS